MAQLTEDRICDLQDIFNLFDEKGDGKIAAYHLGEVLRAMGENPTQAEVKKCGYEGRENPPPSDPSPPTKDTPPKKDSPLSKFKKKDVKKPPPPKAVERLSFEIVLPIMQTISRNKPLVTYDDLVEGFRVFDKDQNGIVSSAEMRHLLTGLGERLSPEEADQLLQGIEDNQGNINYEELIRIVMSS